MYKFSLASSRAFGAPFSSVALLKRLTAARQYRLEFGKLFPVLSYNPPRFEFHPLRLTIFRSEEILLLDLPPPPSAVRINSAFPRAR
jgi:hypothetical protein